MLTAVQKLRPLAEQAGLTMAQLAVAWVLQNPNVSSAIVGATRPSSWQDNVKASGVKLDADLLKAIDEVLDPIVERDPAQDRSARPPAPEPRLRAVRKGPSCRRHGRTPFLTWQAGDGQRQNWNRSMAARDERRRDAEQRR